VFKKSDKSAKSSEDMIRYYAKWLNDYPIVSLEDGLSENDWEGWALLTKELGGKIQLVADDIFVTNIEIFAKGIEKGIANSILIKLNQIGTVSETLDAIDLGRRNGYTSVISHRSGETEDSSLRTLRWRQARDRSRRDGLAHPTGLPSTTSCCGLKKSWGGAARFLGVKALNYRG